MRDLGHRFEWVEPGTLGDNPRNWKTHPPDQLGAFAGLIDDVGFASPIVYNRRTGRILDGHGRKATALARGWPAVPVVSIDLDEAQEAKALAAFDTIGMGALTDPALWGDLLSDVETSSIELQSLLSDVAAGFGIGAGPPDDNDEDAGDEGEAGLAEEPGPDPRAVLDIVWPSDNEYGIPRLDPRWSAPGPVFPLTVWGSVGRRRAMPGTWVFYTADRRFQALWADPAVVLESAPAACIEPNYSLHPQMPRVVALWHTYQKRWIARFWHSKGIATFVDLNCGAGFEAINLLGVPREWRAFAARSHTGTGGVAGILADFAVAAAHAGTDDLVFLVYGGGAEVRELCAARGWFWTPEDSDAARGVALAPLLPINQELPRAQE